MAEEQEAAIAEEAHVADNDEAPAAQTVEEFAEEMGWVPKDRYSGPAEKWKPAKDWIKFDRDANRDLRKKVDRISDQLERQGAASSAMTRRALDKQAEELTAKFEEAVANKDTVGAAKAASDLQRLAIDEPKDRDYEAEFMERNTWYGKDRKATAFARDVSADLGAKKISKEQQLEMIEAEVRKEFPELFGDAGKKPHASVAAPSLGRTSRGKSVADLPAEAKNAMERLIKDMQQRWGDKIKPDDERKTYAQNYFANHEQAA